jgi:hypothetical protein
MAEIENLAIRMSEEEVRYTLHLAEIPTLPGLDDDGWSSLSDRDRGLLLTAAEHGLRARGLLQDDASAAKGVAMPDVVLGILGTCIVATSVLVIRREPLAAEGEGGTYYVGEDLTVEHLLIEPFVHQFTGFKRPDAVLERILLAAELSPLPEAGDGVVPVEIEIPESVLERARAHAVGNHNVEAASNVLQAGGLSLDSATLLAADLDRLEAVTTFLHFHRQEDTASSDGFVVMQAGNHQWLLETDDRDDPLVYGRRSSVQGVRDRIQAVILPRHG